MKERILIIEDETPMRTALADVLEGEGYRALAAAYGEVGLRKAVEEKPDLILLDIMMPKLDGYEVCKAIKSNAATKGTPVILLSAKGRNVDQKMGFDVGADDYITKPFSPRKLVERINQLLGQAISERPASSA